MIQPVQRGSALLDDIQATAPQDGEVAIWWLGQSGFAIKGHSSLIYIDLYLSEHLTLKYANSAKPHIRMTASPLRGEEISGARWVFASHKHSDHLDPGTIPALFSASPEAHLVLPYALIEHATGLGIAAERLITTRGDETLTLDGMTVHSLPSAHPNLDYHPEAGYPFLGFVLEIAGVRLYHSGDTVVYDGLSERLRRLKPQIAFLPINGRAGGEGTPPNMNAEEAIALAGEIGRPLVIPHHYDMFTFNTADVSDFAALADAHGQPYRILQPGERFLFRAP
jgi:L-ascorbate metabolism protein UlaG (beta-lactamase superfamily)